MGAVVFVAWRMFVVQCKLYDVGRMVIVTFDGPESCLIKHSGKVTRKLPSATQKGSVYARF